MSTTETLRYAITDLDDTERKEGRLLTVGDVEYALSHEPEAGTVEISLSDVVGRPIGTRLDDPDTQHFQRDEIAIFARTDAGRRANATPRCLGRGLIQDAQYGTPVVATFHATDALFCDGAAFATEKQFPTWTIPSAYYFLAPPDVYSQAMAVILGEVSDEGAIDPKTSLPSARGLCPLTFVGIDNLPGAVAGISEPWGRFNVCLFAAHSILGVYGSDFGGGIYGQSLSTGATSDGAEPQSVITLDGSPDLSDVSDLGDMAITLYTPKLGKQERQIIAVSGSTVTINNSLATVDCTDVNWFITRKLPQRTKLDLDARGGIDTMVFGYAGYVKATTYEDILSDGESYRVQDLWIRGPLLDAHLAGEVTLTANVIGVESVGDGTGVPITDYFLAYLWWLENCVLQNSKQPRVEVGTYSYPQVVADLYTYADGTYLIKGSSFVEAQAQSAAAFGGAGFQISAYFRDQRSMRDTVGLWNDNGGCLLGQNEQGQFIVWRLNVLDDPTTWPRIEHVSRVFGDVTRTNPQSEMENVVQGSCDWDPDAARYRNALVSVPSPIGIRHNKGIRKYSQVLEGLLTRDPAQWAFVLTERLAARRHGPIYVTFPGDMGLMDYPVGSGIQFTSIMGPAALGYIDRPLIILKKHFAIDTKIVTLTCLDPPGLIDPDLAFTFDDPLAASPRALGSAVAGTALVLTVAARPPLVAVPGASGLGMTSRGAFGGATFPTVLRVTTLSNSGAGSLRTALAYTGGPALIIFETSGTITPSTELVVSNPYTTIAGQTAPSPGITIKNYGIQIQTHDVVIQHLRIRPGGDTCNVGVEAFQTGDPYNLVLDHLSVSWSQSKNFVFTNSARDMNLTVWRCICSEPLYNAPGMGGCPSGGAGYAYGMLFRNNAKQAAVIQCLFAHNSERNPDSSGSAQTYSANNLIYNYQTLATFYEDPDGAEPPGLLATHVGNAYKTGPSTTPTSYLYGSRYLASGSQVYIADTTVDYTGSAPIGFTVINGDGINPTTGVSTPPVTVAGYQLIASADVAAVVLATAGARPADRDTVDTRIVAEVLARTGSLIAHQSDVGGWPSLAVNTTTHVLPSNETDILPSGISVLQSWVNDRAAEVE